jgi:hypothetical protein
MVDHIEPLEIHQRVSGATRMPLKSPLESIT